MVASNIFSDVCSIIIICDVLLIRKFLLNGMSHFQLNITISLNSKIN